MAKKQPKFYTVEEGIPLVEPNSYKSAPSPALPFSEMRVGDSFLVPRERGLVSRDIHAAGMAFAKRRNIDVDFIIRRVPDGWRCWRVK